MKTTENLKDLRNRKIVREEHYTFYWGPWTTFGPTTDRVVSRGVVENKGI